MLSPRDPAQVQPPANGPPIVIPAWQLGLCFALEVGALLALGRYAGGLGRGAWSYVAALGDPACAALVWATFAVQGDPPSRSGKAPIPVPGGPRLAIELAVFLGGAAALAARQSWVAFALFMVALVVHHAMTTDRLTWLLRQELFRR